LFEYCSILDGICPFAGKQKDHYHCGIKTGSIFETRISNMTKCPRKVKKNGRR
jgi:hypothetical protein|tara:strand:+ start:1890 stop:2048 length:159 start_codon:yes stop_codon:yes gene_type:complete